MSTFSGQAASSVILDTMIHVPEHQEDAIAFITVRLHANGALSVQGHVGHKRLALQMLEHAKDAIGRQFPEDKQIFVPGRDVDIVPTGPLKEFGDIPVDQRGDP